MTETGIMTDMGTRTGQICTFTYIHSYIQLKKIEDFSYSYSYLVNTKISRQNKNNSDNIDKD